MPGISHTCYGVFSSSRWISVYHTASTHNTLVLVLAVVGSSSTVCQPATGLCASEPSHSPDEHLGLNTKASSSLQLHVCIVRQAFVFFGFKR